MPDTLTTDERAELEALRSKQATATAIKCKVGQKGGVSVYGLGRFPVTLYAGQWERLLASADDVLAFIAANERFLDRKDA